MDSVKFFEISAVKYDDELNDNLFIDHDSRFIYSFLNNTVNIYTIDFKIVKKIKLSEGNSYQIRKIKQLKDDTFIIITDKNLIRYSPPELFETISFEKDLYDIHTSPDNKWMLIYSYTFRFTSHFSRNTTLYNCKILKFYNFGLVKNDPEIINDDISKLPIYLSKIIGICNDGSILLNNNKIITKYNNPNDYISRSFDIEGSSAFYLSHDGKVLFAVIEYNNIILINVDDLSLIRMIPIHNMSFIHNSVDNIIYLINILLNCIQIFDMQCQEITHIMQLKFIKSSVKYIIKKDNLLVIYLYTKNTFVYDLKTKQNIKTFSIPKLNNIVTSMCVSSNTDQLIIYSPNMIAKFNPLLNKEAEKAFLLGSLVHENLPCALNNFLNNRLFDRHLLPLIFEFMPSY